MLVFSDLRQHGTRLLTLAVVVSLYGSAAAQPLAGWSWERSTIDSTRSGRAFGMALADVTGDGYTDIASGAYVYRNPGGDPGGVWARAELPGDMDAVAAFDVDGDDRGDVFSVNCDGAWWCEALDRQGSAWDTLRVSDVYACDHSMSTQGYACGQLEPGGPAEVVVATHHQGIVCFSVPENPSLETWPAVTIVDTYSEGLALGDFDSDGDLDVCGGGTGTDPAVWWAENPGQVGSGAWAVHNVGTTDADLDRIAAIDIDGDSLVDIVATEEASTTNLYWFRQGADSWERRVVATGSRYLSMDVGDIDHDGDGDIITGEEVGSRRIQFWVYADGALTPVLVDNLTTHIGCLLADLDNDGDLDIASNSWADPENVYVWETRSALTVRRSISPQRASWGRPGQTGAFTLSGRAACCLNPAPQLLPSDRGVHMPSSLSRGADR